MQQIPYEHSIPQTFISLKTNNQFAPTRRDSIHSRTIFEAVREWESTLPGQAQEKIAQLVAEQWAKRGGRGIAVNKQNLFRYLKNESGSGASARTLMAIITIMR